MADFILQDNDGGSVTLTRSETADIEVSTGDGAPGAPGPQGAEGPVGAQGPAGDPTVVNGKSGASITLDQDDIGDGTTYKQFSSTEKAKLAAISGTNTGDQDLTGLVPKTTTVNTKALTTNITLDKTDIGLPDVDNTSDEDKPVSTAQQTAIDNVENDSLAYAVVL